MIIKRYIVNNMNEAMTRIKYELGKDAIIISQRKIRKSGIFSIFSKRVIEVTAAVENDNKSTDESELKSSLENITKMISDLQSSSKSITHYGKETNELETLLKSTDLNKQIIKSVLSEIKNHTENLDEKIKLKKTIEKRIQISENKFEKIMVLVGPTGVGKTTTIAKLAGKLALIDKKKVGLITIDTYRIGAVEQLRTYADIMNIPFKVVITTKDMENAIDSMRDCEAILIDTTGRSSKNTMQLSELRSFVEKANTANIHLVISCTTKNNDISSIVEGYKILNYNNVIITKLDETSTYGSILNILDCAKKPLSFVTVGQDVPDDLKRLSAAHISNLILGEDTIC
jgi:flagellar biosynthesis protein FlhF